MLSVDKVLSDYKADRKSVVISFPRLCSACKSLSRHIGRCKVSRLSRERLARYTNKRCREDVALSTVGRELGVLRAALRMKWHDGKLRRLPVIRLPPKSQPAKRVLDAHERRRMRAAVLADRQLLLFYVIALSTGQRRTAVLELTWDRVNFARNEIDFRAPHPLAHRRKNRPVLPMDGLRQFLRAAKRVAKGPLVVGLSASTLHRRFNKAVERAGLTHFTPHALRHTVATSLVRSRKDIKEVSMLLGHKSLAITDEVYTHLGIKDLARAARAAARLAGIGRERKRNTGYKPARRRKWRTRTRRVLRHGGLKGRSSKRAA